MARFSLFRRKKQETQPESKTPAAKQPISDNKTPNEQLTSKEASVERPSIETPQSATPTPTASAEKTGEEAKTYLKAMPLRELTDLEAVEKEVRSGNIVILRITPLASKSITDVKQAVDQLYAFAEEIHGDIARLGEERVVVCPENIRIWREKTPAQNPPSLLPTAA